MSIKMKLLQIALGAVGSLVSALIAYVATGEASTAMAGGVVANVTLGDIVNRMVA